MFPFTPEILKYIKEGEWILLGVILLLIIVFFKWIMPKIQHKINGKVTKTECELNRNGCNQVLAAKLDLLRDHFNMEILMINGKIDTVILNQKEAREKLDKLFESKWRNPSPDGLK